jgi:hypothetical protein
MSFGLLAGPWATRTARFQRTPWRILGSFSTESCKARDLLRGRPADDKQSPSGRCGHSRCAAVKNPVTIAQPGGLDNSKAALAQRMHAGDEPAGMAGGRRKDRPLAHCARPVRAAGVQQCSLRTTFSPSQISSQIYDFHLTVIASVRNRLLGRLQGDIVLAVCGARLEEARCATRRPGATG